MRQYRSVRLIENHLIIIHNSKPFFLKITHQLHTNYTAFFHHPFLNLSLISRFLYIGHFWRENLQQKFGAKDCEGIQGGTVAQSHSTYKASGSSGGNLLLSYSQVEAISYSVTLKWRQSPAQSKAQSKAQVEAIHRVYFMRYHNIS
jgi:hypothetical protein